MRDAERLHVDLVGARGSRWQESNAANVLRWSDFGRVGEIGWVFGTNIVSATATRRDFFAIVPLGLAAVARSAMTWGYSAPRN
jgi:hypothetical protein